VNGGLTMKIEIEIDEKYITELVSQEIAKRIVAEHGYESREGKFGIREGVDKAIKQYIYSKKDEVIERVVDRASVEIVKKGLPKLLEKL
jgi:Cys-tRNA synthase (O-phospho-L-seryl-tRNA:Cys-tRNA synthase)